MSPQRPLAEFVKPPEVSSAALHLEWHEVRRRVRRRRQVRATVLVVAVLAVVGLASQLFLFRTPVEPFAWRATESAEGEPRLLQLAEGSEVKLSIDSVAQLVEQTDDTVEVRLERGRAFFDVVRKPSRRFVVKADDVEVRVVGTQFTVIRNGRDVDVQVSRGIVEVREGDQVKRLTKGESWSRHEAITLAPAPLPPEPAVEEPAPVVTTEPKSPQPKRPVKTTRLREPEPGPAAPVVSAPAPPPPQDPQPAPSNEPTPADTFAAAMRARSEGHAKEAIRGFQQVTERWPSSAYAPMSAFEWGRLALDTQDDPRQAARAFERTLELATASSLIEDALARLTEAYARYDVGSCRRVQSEYLRRFPGGPHVRGVTKACPP